MPRRTIGREPGQLHLTTLRPDGESSALVESAINRRSPGLSKPSREGLAAAWAGQLDAVVDRVMKLTLESGRMVLPRRARPAAIKELASLIIWLSDRIVERLADGRDLASIDLDTERLELLTPKSLERIENSARVVAQSTWFKTLDRLLEANPLVIELPEQLPVRTPRVRRGEAPPTSRNHYVPRFSVEPWANSSGQLRVLSRQPNGTISSRNVGYKSWGFEYFLYDQQLEDWFSRIESNAKASYEGLRNLEPLSDQDRSCWIAFMAVQYVRTPLFMATMARRLQQRAVQDRWPWLMSPDLLRRAHATLFKDDHFFSAFHNRLDRRRWRILIAANCRSFPRTDAPFFPTRVGKTQWTGYYPLSPTQCFSVGPEVASAEDVPAALSTELSIEETEVLNARLLRASRKSCCVRIADSEEPWRVAAASWLPRTDPTNSHRAWGPLDKP